MDKPAIPYVKGEQLTVYHNISPEPTPRKYGGCKDYRELKQYSPLQYCLLHPPLNGKTIKGDSLAIKITEQIAVRDGHSSQVVAISGDRVAKIYDSLHCPDPTGNGYCHMTPWGY